MKKIILPLLLLPMMFGLSGKNTVKTKSFATKSASFAIVSRSSASQDFLDYWLVFRAENPEVCEIDRATFNEMYYGHYLLLDEEDRKIVIAAKDIDEDYTIGQVIQGLVNTFFPNHNKVKEEKQKLDQSSIIVIATVVALVGATAISVLFILKNNKVIK